MTTVIAALTLDRPSETRQTWAHNLRDLPERVRLFRFDNGSDPANQSELDEIAGRYDVEATWYASQNVGISRAINRMLDAAFDDPETELVITMASDLLEPGGWVTERLAAIKAIPNIAVVAIPPSFGALRYPVHPGPTRWENGDVIGNFGITRAAYERIGHFHEGYGIYGPLDLDYCQRARSVGMKTIYLSGMTSDHIGTNDPPEYKKAKADSLRLAWDIFRNRRHRWPVMLDPYEHYK